jgi:hypothetical protein
MNRRSILSSLSSMCLAALAWPRNAAAAGSGPKYALPSYNIKVKNAFVGEGGKLIPGPSTLNVWAYAADQVKTLTGGDVGKYGKGLNYGGRLQVTIYAAFPEQPIQQTTATIYQFPDTTLYYLAYADSRTRTPRITIEQAPAGVKF